MIRRVGCAGIVVADIFCGPVKALPPAGQLLAVDEIPVKVGGCAANVAIDLLKQGIDVDLAGCVGDDPSAGLIMGILEQAGVGVSQIRSTALLPTSKTVILLVDGEDRRYLHTFGANAAFSIGGLSSEWIESLDVLYLGGLGVLPSVRHDELVALLKRCRALDIVSVVDVVLPHTGGDYSSLLALLPHIDYFLPNSDEGRALTGEHSVAAMLDIMQDAGANTVVVTLGSAGAVAMQSGKRIRCGCYPATRMDPSGAGDAFAAGIITAIVNDWSMPKALRYAGALGASAISKVGTTDGVFDAREAEQFIRRHRLDLEHDD
jgi:sugar/nucleoside kinase (ribokinase family)